MKIFYVLGYFVMKDVDVPVHITPILLIQDYYYEPRIQHVVLVVAVVNMVMLMLRYFYVILLKYVNQKNRKVVVLVFVLNAVDVVDVVSLLDVVVIHQNIWKYEVYSVLK
jgi:hypothetical protein